MNQKSVFSNFGKFAGACALAATFSACQNLQPQQTATSEPTTNANVAATTAASPVASPTVAANNAATAALLPVTLPVLDAMFADENFASDLKSKLGVSDEQVEKLKTTAREAVANMEETESGSTNAATKAAEAEIRTILGEDKSKQLAQFVSERWQGGEAGAATNASGKPNSVPTDTRIVVNAPAYRMDVFRDGQLLRSYKVGIGYPEFPLPSGERTAKELIYNPTWTPPDEPWVKGKVKAGQKVAAGSPLNPLGPIKIPIGSPSLIHGGKSPARLGSFASHGCVGLTNDQVQEVALIFAQLTNTDLTPEKVAEIQKDKTETKNIKLAQPLPVELRYETIVVEDGKLHIYRDVYERGTNTEENLRRVLDANGVSFDSLSEQERAQIQTALQQMARDAEGNVADPSTAAQPMSQQNGNTNKAATKNSNQNGNSNGKVKETKTVKGQKEIVIEIAALKGKGYPAPVDLNAGAKSKKPLNLNGNTAQNTATNNSSNGNSNKTTTTNGNSSSKRF